MDTDFKNRYFKQESEFEKFADSNFFSKNEITIKEYEQIQNTHVFTVSVKMQKTKMQIRRTKNNNAVKGRNRICNVF